MLVTSGHDPIEIGLAQALVRHLRADVEVRRADRDRLEQMRQAGDIRAATLVVLVEVRLLRDMELRTTSRPETVCGPSGCYNRTRTDTYDVPILRARAMITVYDGPSASILQRAEREVLERGRTWEQMGARIFTRLRDELRVMVDGKTEAVRVRLLAVDDPDIQAGLELLAAAQWSRAREALESAVSRAAPTLDTRDRARALYDLGIARRFDPTTLRADPVAHFDAAEASLRQAVQLDPREVYAKAIADLREHRMSELEARRQHTAAAQNRAHEHSFPPPGAAPPPPPSYSASPSR